MSPTLNWPSKLKKNFFKSLLPEIINILCAFALLSHHFHGFIEDKNNLICLINLKLINFIKTFKSLNKKFQENMKNTQFKFNSQRQCLNIFLELVMQITKTFFLLFRKKFPPKISIKSTKT